MTQVLHATFDGQVLRPEEAVELEPNTRVRITIEAVDPPAMTTASFLQTARLLRLDGPRDWSARLEDYLYGNASDDNG
jgi:hypothetical protein